jgi:beta-glucosidase
VIDNWTPHGEKLDVGSVALKGGQAYRLRLEYFEETGSAALRFGMVGADAALPARVRQLASQAQAVIYCGGFSASSEGEGVDRSFAMSASQVRAIRQLSALNRRTIVVLNGGGNVDGEGWMDGVAGLIHAWYPGQEGGTALGQLIWGDVSPSGKLPASFERKLADNPAQANYYPQRNDKRVEYREGLFLGYRHFDRSSVKPRFPFGHGLSYTRFRYTDLRVSATAASFTLKNVGPRRGAEVAQLYVSDGHARLPRPLKELKGFAKVDLAPGETRRVTLPLNRRAFAYWDPARHDWVVDPGKFTLMVGASSQDIRLRSSLDYR